MKNYLTKLGATNIQTDLMQGNDTNGIYNQKMKILFAVNEKESAVECYNDICSYSKTNLFGKHGNYLNIFYLKDGPTLVRYGDIAAEKWYQQEEEKKLIQAERQAKQEKELAFRGNKQEVPEKTQDY